MFQYDAEYDSEVSNRCRKSITLLTLAAIISYLSTRQIAGGFVSRGQHLLDFQLLSKEGSFAETNTDT